MLFMMHAKLAKPEGMSNKEFYGVWEKEVQAAVAALRSGALKALYKVPGTPEVVGILDVNTARRPRPRDPQSAHLEARLFPLGGRDEVDPAPSL